MKISHALTVSLAVLLGACGRDEPQALVASAKEYIAKREFSASIIQLKNALQQQPNNAEARYLLGFASLENGDVASADAELGKARELGYRADELQVALARTVLAKGQAAKVVEEFAGTRLASPQLQAQLRATVGTAQLAQNHRAEAQRAFAGALALDPASVMANIGLARLAAAERDFAGAMARVATALAASPASAETLLLKAELLAAQGQNEASEKAYRDAIAAAPGQVSPRLALIGYLVRNGSRYKASAEVAALENLAPKDPRSAYAKALVLSEQGNFAGAREAILEVLKVAPGHAPSLMIAGRAAFETGAYGEAESYLRKLVQVVPQAIGAKRLLAATHLRMGQTDLALTEVKDLLARAGDDAGIVALSGEVYLASGDIGGAARQYEKARSLAPKNSTVQTRLGLVRLAAGDSDRGLQELESAAASHPEDYQPDLALVTAYLRQQQADKALEAVKALEKKQPQNPLTYNMRGVALLLKHDFAGARASFERSLELNATYMPAINNLAQLDLHDKKPGEAKKRYEAVLKKEPNNEQALSRLAVLLRISGAPKEEIEKLLTQAAERNPGSPNARIALINFYERNRDFRKALAAAQEAQVALPNDSAITAALGNAQLAAGETRQSISTLQRLTEMAPKAPQAFIQLARAQLAARQADDAINSLRTALALQPDLALVERDIASIYVATGRYDAALAEARAMQKARPEQPLGYMLEGEIYVAQKRFQTAERTFLTALKKFDLPILAARTHAVMTAAGKVSEANVMAEKWLSAHPKDASVLIYLGQRDLAEKRYADAERRYQGALGRQPDNPLVLNNLAWVSNQLKQPKALEYAERANEIAPENPEIMDTLGTILSQSGENERALQLLGRAAELAPNAHQIRLNFARALVKAGRKDAARKELEPLAKLDSKLPVQQQAAALLAGL